MLGHLGHGEVVALQLRAVGSVSLLAVQRFGVQPSAGLSMGAYP